MTSYGTDVGMDRVSLPVNIMQMPRLASLPVDMYRTDARCRIEDPHHDEAQSERACHAAAFSFVTQPTWPAAFGTGAADSDARHDGCSCSSSALSLW